MSKQSRRTAARKDRQAKTFTAFKKAGGYVRGRSGEPVKVPFSHLTEKAKQRIIEAAKDNDAI